MEDAKGLALEAAQAITGRMFALGHGEYNATEPQRQFANIIESVTHCNEMAQRITDLEQQLADCEQELLSMGEYYGEEPVGRL